MHRIAFALGVAVLAGTWLGPLPDWATAAFSAHMTMHMSVVAAAAPLIAVGLAGGRFDPARTFPSVVAPLPASLVELAVVWTWHAPALHRAARHDGMVLLLEQGTFLAAGLLLWVAIFGGAPQARAARAGAGVVALLLTSMHMTLLGALLALAPRPLYAHEGMTDLTALADQHLGGAIMLLAGGIVYLAAGLGLMIRLLRRSTAIIGGSA